MKIVKRLGKAFRPAYVTIRTLGYHITNLANIFLF